MGPIVQYVLGVPIGLFCLFYGLYAAYGVFMKTNEEENHNGFGAGLAFLVLSAFGFLH